MVANPTKRSLEEAPAEGDMALVVIRHVDSEGEETISLFKTNVDKNMKYSEIRSLFLSGSFKPPYTTEQVDTDMPLTFVGRTIFVPIDEDSDGDDE